MNDKQLGVTGEEFASRYLETNQYRILCRNFRTAYGELDIIAQDKDTLVFIEVKTRRSTQYGQPGEAVSYRKQRKLSRMAAIYLARHNVWHWPCRFDVIEVFASRGTEPRIHHIRHAFWLE